MTAKKRLIFVTGIASAISMVSAAVFAFIADNDFWTNFSFAVFGSSLLGFIMSLVEYFVEKRSALEEYYLAAVDLTKIYSHAKYFFIGEPKTLLLEYFTEQQTMLAKSVLSEQKIFPAKDKLLQHMRNVWANTIDIPEPEFSQYVSLQFNEEIQKYNIALQETLESYIQIAVADFRILENAFGKINFLFTNHRFRKKIYSDIHSPLREYHRVLSRKTYQFKSFLKAQNGNTAAMIDIVVELQERYYKIVKQSDEYTETVTVYQQFLDDINDKIEWLRCKMYRKEYEPTKQTPFEQYQRVLRAHAPIPAPIKHEK